MNRLSKHWQRIHGLWYLVWAFDQVKGETEFCRMATEDEQNDLIILQFKIRSQNDIIVKVFE